MKKLLLHAVSLAALTGSAIAADLPARKELVVAPIATPMWTGFHVGLNAGGIWNNNNAINVSSWPISYYGSEPALWAPLNSTVSSGNNGGFIGGGQIGYDWQVPYAGMGFVTGIEADIQGIASSGGNVSRNSLYPGPYNGGTLNIPGVGTPPYNWNVADYTWNNVSGSAKLQYLGTVRGRIGYLVLPSFLVYGTGGLAYGGVSINLNQSQIFNVTESQGATSNLGGWAAFGNANYSNTQVGYTAGGGAEWMFMPNWSAKAEYIYYNLGNVSLTSVMTAVPTGTTIAAGGTNQLWNASTANTTLSGNIVRAGVNYHFNFSATPVVAKY